MTVDSLSRFRRLIEDYGTAKLVNDGVVPHIQVTVPNWIGTKNIPLTFEGLEVRVFSQPPSMDLGPVQKAALPLTGAAAPAPKIEEMLMDEPINVISPKDELADKSLSAVMNEILGNGRTEAKSQPPPAAPNHDEILTIEEFSRIARLYPPGLDGKSNIKGVQNASVDTIISSVISFVAAGGDYASFKACLNARLKRYEK